MHFIAHLMRKVLVTKDLSQNHQMFSAGGKWGGGGGGGWVGTRLSGMYMCDD